MLQRVLILVLVLITFIHQGATSISHGPAVEEFSRYEVVWPRVRLVRNKRHAPSELQDGFHAPEIEISVFAKGQELVLDLQLNRDLMSNAYFEKHQNSPVIPGTKDSELCQYQGTIRGVPDSWAAISACDGISGVVYDGDELIFIEPSAEGNNKHLILQHRHLLSNNYSCGTTNHDHTHHFSLDHKRTRREVQAAYSSERNPRFLEMLLVVDNAAFTKLGGTSAKVTRHCKNLINILNAVTSQLNILVALVGVVMWSRGDEIANPSTITYKKFLDYRRDNLLLRYPNDNAQLLVGGNAEQGVVGRAPVSSICLRSESGAVIVEHSNIEALVALTMAHELGHNLGMNHDTRNCRCPDKQCIMAEALNSESHSKWSSCSIDSFAKTMSSVHETCLLNKPKSLFEGPVCGNGFLESGEECDCGPEAFCDTPCCNALTCRLTTNATCGTGPCCDKKTCHLLRAGTECRPNVGECDLPEFCKGDSEICPQDMYKANGEECDQGEAYCYDGQCGSLQRQCHLLWGRGSRPANKMCYDLNARGGIGGNCGYKRETNSYIKCDKQDLMCGRIYCTREDFVPLIGYETIVTKVQDSIHCHVAKVDMEKDIGLVSNGAKCGQNRMCVEQRCVPVASAQPIANCSTQCYGHGVCNNAGHCHCDRGFAPPDCTMVGFGGSLDSGPSSDPDTNSLLVGFLIFLFAILFMAALITLLVFYSRRLNSNIGVKKGYLPSAPRTNITRNTKAVNSKTTSRFNARSTITNSRIFSIFRPSSTQTTTVATPVAIVHPSSPPPPPPGVKKTDPVTSRSSPAPGPPPRMIFRNQPGQSGPSHNLSPGPSNSEACAIVTKSTAKKNSNTKLKQAPAVVKSETNVVITSSKLDVPAVKFQNNKSKQQKSLAVQPTALPSTKITTTNNVFQSRPQSKINVSNIAKKFESTK